MRFAKGPGSIEAAKEEAREKHIENLIRRHTTAAIKAYHDNFVAPLEARIRIAERVIAAIGDTPVVAEYLASLNKKEGGV